MSDYFGPLFKYPLAVLAIGVVVLSVYASNSAATEAANISALDAKAAHLYAGKSSTASLTDTVLIAAGLAPQRMVSGTTALINPLGGAVTVTGDASGDINITDSGLSQGFCEEEATVVKYTTLAINGGTATAQSAVTPATITTGCAATEATDYLNTLVFVFK